MLAGGSVPLPLHPVVSVKMWLPLGLCAVQDSRRHRVGGSDMIWEWRAGRREGGESSLCGDVSEADVRICVLAAQYVYL